MNDKIKQLRIEQLKCIVKAMAHTCLIIWLFVGMFQLLKTGTVSSKILFDMIIFLYITQ